MASRFHQHTVSPCALGALIVPNVSMLNFLSFVNFLSNRANPSYKFHQRTPSKTVHKHSFHRSSHSRFQGLSRISPVSGPAEAAGTRVTFYGRGFVNTTLLACRFGYAPPVPATFISPNELSCESPPLVIPTVTGTRGAERTSGLDWSALSEIRQRDVDPLTGSRRLFPRAHYFPLFLQRAVGAEVCHQALQRALGHLV